MFACDSAECVLDVLDTVNEEENDDTKSLGDNLAIEGEYMDKMIACENDECVVDVLNEIMEDDAAEDDAEFEN